MADPGPTDTAFKRYPSKETIARLPGVYAASIVQQGNTSFALRREEEGKTLLVQAEAGEPVLERFKGERETRGDGVLLRCPLSAENAVALRHALPWLTPVPLGLKTSAGCGDRLGLATPGHVRAFKEVAGIAPIFAQQSIREMNRTRRTPEEVMTTATWGAFEAGWQEHLGADADHLKTTADIDRCARAGFTLFTLDPGEHVDDAADGASPKELEASFEALPWEGLESSARDFMRYSGHTLDLGERALTISDEDVLCAGVKYGRALLHVTRLYRHLEAKGIPFELEVSVDETASPTSPAEHAVMALELGRLGVSFVSLAPRFVGAFEKGIDYRGDLAALDRDLEQHAAIARALGPYKLSLHSGSDKFSVYALAERHTGGRVHLKTAGTSYLEALRVLARVEPKLFRRVLALAHERFAEDRASYHLSARLEEVPEPDALSDAELPELLEQDDSRQVLHVTFGSALERFGAEIRERLLEHEEAHYQALRAHFIRHLAPFGGRA